jgi:two-component SAPR family response regulator
MSGRTGIAARCFGEFSLRIDNRPVDGWHAGKARNLFQYLLVNRGHLVRREKLFETLWPDTEWSPTASSLKVAMHAVRQVLGSAAGRRLEVITRDHGYLLETGDLWLDVEDFDRAMTAARTAESRGDEETAEAGYRHAAELYAGDFLAAEDGDWIVEQREWYRTRVLYALSYLRACALRRREHAVVIDVCRQILKLDPYHEESYQAIMLLHGRRGELGQVRNWHRLCERRLRHDLNLRPTDTTSRIYRRAVRGELRHPAAS